MQMLSQLIVAGALMAMPQISFAQDSRPVDEQHHEVTWIEDFDVAQALAKAQNKDMLVDFTGSDWCIWCKRLHAEVFSTPSFQSYASENFILVMLDYPQDPKIQAKVPNPDRNAELAVTYNITGYPTVLLMSPDGEVFGRTGYMKGGPEIYNQNLATMLSTGKVELASAKKMIAEWEAVTDENRVVTYKRILAAFQESALDSVLSTILMPVIPAALNFDADNALGLKLQATKALLETGQGDEALLQAARDLDPKNEKGLLEVAVAAEFKLAQSDKAAAKAIEQLVALDGFPILDSELAIELYYFGALFSWKYLDDAENARMFALKLEALESGNPNVANMLKDLFQDLGREAGVVKQEENDADGDHDDDGHDH